MDAVHIIYVAPVFDDACLKKYFGGKYVLSYAASVYHTLLARGLSANNAKVDILSVLPVNRQNCSKVFVKGFDEKTEGVHIRYMSVMNVRFLKYLFWFMQVMFTVLFSGRDTVVLYDVLYTSAAFGAILAAKLRKLKLIGIVTDFPDFSLTSQKAKNVKIKRVPIDAADAYIFLTKQMDERLNPKRKPFIVLEGHVNQKMAYREHREWEKNKKTIIYAGSIMKKYGISVLCDAFIKYSLPDEELHIYGIGDYEHEVRELQDRYKRIIYYGNRPNEEVVEAELNATLLVNPRPTDEEFTKYSFPSKTLEYMVSGTPVLSSRLAGIPDVYQNYIFFFDDNTPEALGMRMREILDLSPEVLSQKGAAARAFVLKEKNNHAQAKKIIEFIRDAF